MIRKFLESHEYSTPSFYPKPSETLYFFYGALMDPHTLAKVLVVKHVPITQDAIIRGYHCKLSDASRWTV
ncbi:hypothetical protein BDD12DRAFT_846386 [Trichophaea hybrida]|nr:hypothetical protein BDD12DRAFT_846386 [Trichophaea hybrida]